MAAISIKTNLPEVTAKLRDKINKLKDKEYLIRPVCVDLIDLMTNRIHMKGEGAEGSQIGLYSVRYWKLRQKPPYNRNSDQKIVVSLTRQLENDWSIIATPKGYGIGFKNSFNLQKARWVEARKGRKIFGLTSEEIEFAKARFDQLVQEAFND